MQKYLIFIDVDGTLVYPSTYEIDSNIIDDFIRLKSDGHIIVVVTGRSLKSTYGVKGIENASYISGLMGSVTVRCEDKKQIIAPKTMDSSIIKDFISTIEERGFRWTYKDDYEQKTYYNDKDILSKFTTRAVDKEEYFDDLNNNRICQLLVDGDFPQDIMDKYPMYDYFKMPHNYCDVVIKGSSKADIVRYFKAKYPEYKVVSIGDSNNDRAMFSEADISIAMGNATDEIKAITTYSTKRLEDGGVIYAFREILKI